jgi:hypothetical protein
MSSTAGRKEEKDRAKEIRGGRKGASEEGRKKRRPCTSFGFDFGFDFRFDFVFDFVFDFGLDMLSAWLHIHDDIISAKEV